MSSQASILDLPPEILEKIFREINTTEDSRNCLIAVELCNDPRISKILCQIRFDNEGILYLETIFTLSVKVFLISRYYIYIT